MNLTTFRLQVNFINKLVNTSRKPFVGLGVGVETQGFFYGGRGVYKLPILATYMYLSPLRSKFIKHFESNKIGTQGCLVRSANATSVLCSHPPGIGQLAGRRKRDLSFLGAKSSAKFPGLAQVSGHQ